MEVENNIVLDLNFQFAFILIDVGNHIVLLLLFSVCLLSWNFQMKKRNWFTKIKITY